MKSIRTQFKSLSFFLFNLIMNFYHHLNSSQIELLHKCNLFASMSENDFHKMLGSIKLVKYQEGSPIIKEYEIGKDLYVIADGSVRVFTHDINGVKIALQRLNKGDYFGEQALLRQTHATRNASVEAITDILLMQIPGKFLIQHLGENTQLKSGLTKKGYEQALHLIAITTKYYSDIEVIISQLDAQSNIVDFRDNEVIFNVGDKSENVFIIFQGEVILHLSNPVTKSINRITLHKGQLFGEVGVLEDKPRAATAIAKGNLQLLVISNDSFKNYIAKSPQMLKILSSLKQIYQMPMKGIIEQYVGSLQNLGNSITNIYKMEDGRSIVASRFVNEDFFTMSLSSNLKKEASYIYQKGKDKIELDVSQKHIIGIRSYGILDNLAKVCLSLINNEEVEEATLKEFQLSGELKPPSLNKLSIEKDIICTCMSVSKSRLQKLMDEGIKDLETLSMQTGACTVCRSCEYKILEMLGKSVWLSATMKRLITHNEHIRSYIIKPTNGTFNSLKPGQHIIIQIKINDYLIERPYTVSGIQPPDAIRVTIKREPKGFFTNWLYENDINEFKIKVTQPQGSFLLKLENKSCVLCFAGGIGITPFISFANALWLNNSDKKLHLLYAALSKSDFVFTDEFKKVSNLLPSFTVDYRATDVDGLLQEQDIIHILKNFHDPDVYICGPAGFVKLVETSLKAIGYSQDKIFIEKFVHAGSHN